MLKRFRRAAVTAGAALPRLTAAIGPAACNSRRCRAPQSICVPILALLATLWLSGCAGWGAGRSALPPGATRDSLLTTVAGCHLLRVGQNMDSRVTDATVLAATKRYGYSLEEVVQRSNGMLAAYRGRPAVLGGLATQSCVELGNLTGVRPALVRFDSASPPRSIWVRVDGAEIGDGFAKRIAGELRKSRAVGLVINSPGGSVGEARELGRYLRANGLRTAVDGACTSACIDILAGGSERYATRRAVLGVHRSWVPSRYSSHEGGQLYVAESYRYLREMGVEADVAIAAATIPHSQLLVIPLADALRTRLITAVVEGL
jgi:hypothetical protein